MTQERRTLVNRALVIVLTIWGLAVIIPEFARVFIDYATLGFEANNDGLVTVVSGPPASDAGMRRSDCIDLDQTQRRDLLAVFGGMGGMTYVRPGLEVTLYVEPAPCTRAHSLATPRVLKARATAATPANRLMLALVEILGVFFIAIGAVLVWQRPSAMTWGFFLYGVWFNPGQYFVFYAQLQRFPYLLLLQEFLQSAAQAVGYAGFIVFALRFPRDIVEPQWRYVERLLPAVVALLFVLQLASFGTAMGFRTEAIGRWSYALGYVVDIAVLLILRFRRKTQPPEDQQRTRWVHWACRVGLFAFIFADSNMATSFWDPVVGPFCTHGSSLARLTCDDGVLSETTLLAFFTLNATIPIAVFHAVRHHRVIDIRFALSRGTTMLLTSIIIAGALAAAGTWIEELLKESLASQILVYVLIVIVMKLVFELLHEQFNHTCDRLFFRRLHFAEKSLRRVADELPRAENFDAIDRKLIVEPAGCLDLASAAVFRREPSGIFRQKTDPIGWAGGRDADLPLEESTLKELARRREAMRLRESEAYDPKRPKTFEPVIAMPVIAAQGLVAVALYGAHNTGNDVTAEEHEIMQALVAPAGNAYNGVEVIALQREVEELSRRLQALPYDIFDVE